MAMGKRKREAQGALWVAAGELPQSGGHPFYEQVNKLLDAEGFDRFVEDQCRAFYAAARRPRTRVGVNETARPSRYSGNPSPRSARLSSRPHG